MFVFDDPHGIMSQDRDVEGEQRHQTIAQQLAKKKRGCRTTHIKMLLHEAPERERKSA